MSDQEIPLSRPDITELEEQLVLSVLRSERLSIGPMLEQFESLVAETCGTQFAVGVSSGTTGLHLVLQALGVKPGDEVITTPFSFIASANCILYVGATPVFVDIDPRSLNMDPALVERAITPRTRAILAVETFGNPSMMDQYASIAARHEIPLIEDCCEALGCSLRGRPAGSFGRVGVFGFYPNKQITTGEGGMIVTDDERLADLCRSLRNQGRPTGRADGAVHGSAGSWLRHQRLGYNARMSEIQAALGVAQMKRFGEIVRQRNRVADLYMRRLAGNPELIMPTIDPDVAMSWFVFVVRLSAGYTMEERDRLIRSMRNHDVGAADYFPCIHLQPFYRERFGFQPGAFPIAESVSQRTIALPFHNRLTEREIDLVAQTLELMLTREGLQRG
ncbi:MAG: DegT/DnrJ/EryC1/StrS family aminotransferase [Phycisphaeraceae bacterium]|nr:DegT/DnrJ/EryC1/StrS family aminotransferase [Phycisphaeraceae bacterium]MBX3367472.1 DegT/DnrJ/EryC1/StrS family aminotransferase [Phycisphaeraceae bacterium]QYK47051.1 MAG: DegT/DnrJ/EryC1/StrS family aminotransferase [Phycisphaeraceae bacterium]